MGKNGKRRGDEVDWDQMDADNSNEDESVSNNNKQSRGKAADRTGGSNSKHSGKNGTIPELLDSQADPNFTPYLEVVENLKNQMADCQRAMKTAHTFYDRQKRDIRNAVKNRERLDELTAQCTDLRTTIQTLKDLEKDKNEELDKKIADHRKETEKLLRAKDEAKKFKAELENDKEKLNKRAKAAEVQQKAELEAQRVQLEEEQQQKYDQRVEALEKETQELWNIDKAKMTSLEAKNKELAQRIEERESELKAAQKRCKNAETLQTVYEERAEKLKKELATAENEFGLNCNTDDFYAKGFSKIDNEIKSICSRYVKELYATDLNALHDEVEKPDEVFKTVPISHSKISEELRPLHGRRVIAELLVDVIWQPFSSDTAFQNPETDRLFDSISEGLVKLRGTNGGHRAARVCTALAMRGLQQKAGLSSTTTKTPTSTPIGRAETFASRVMERLSMLVKPGLRPNFKNNLLELAKSAITLWNTAQTDQREFEAFSTLDPKSIDGWCQGISAASDGVYVLFPRIIAHSYPRGTDARPVGPPGGWVDLEPEALGEVTCIHAGEGLGEWATLVIDGEEEESKRRQEEAEKKREEKIRLIDEDFKRQKEDSGIGHKRRSSQSKRDSVSSPSAAWMKKGGQPITEGAE